MNTWILLYVKTSNHVQLIAIYRPEVDEKKKKPIAEFFEDLLDLTDDYVLSEKELLIVGDLNLCVNDNNSSEGVRFLDLLSSINLVQHVDEPTHRNGHTLNVLISRDPDFVQNVIVKFRKHHDIDIVTM